MRSKWKRKPEIVIMEVFDPQDKIQHARLGIWQPNHADFRDNVWWMVGISGTIAVEPLDIILTREDGTRFALKPNQFEKEYEPVNKEEEGETSR